MNFTYHLASARKPLEQREVERFYARLWMLLRPLDRIVQWLRVWRKQVVSAK